MHALEWILCLTALLGALGLVVNGMNAHDNQWEETRREWAENMMKMQCSVLWDRVNTHYILSPNQNCSVFTFALHADSGSALLLGMDSNHYE